MINAYDGDWQVTYYVNGNAKTENALIGSGNISVTDLSGKLQTICEIKLLVYSQTGDFVFHFRFMRENVVNTFFPGVSVQRA